MANVPNVPTVRCPHCDRKFPSLRKLNDHVDRDHHQDRGPRRPGRGQVWRPRRRR